MMDQRLPMPRGAIIKFGIVVDNQAVNGRVKVRFADQDHIITRWLPTAHQGTLKDKHYHHPPRNTQVACLMDDQLEDGWILHALYSEPDAVPIDPVYGAPSDDTLTGVYYAEEENSTDYAGFERFKRGPNNHHLFARNGTVITNATPEPVPFADPGATHQISDQLHHIRAPLICLEGDVTITGNLTVAGNLNVAGAIAAGGGIASLTSVVAPEIEEGAGVPLAAPGGGCGVAPPSDGSPEGEAFADRMRRWYARIIAPTGGGVGEQWTYVLDGQTLSLTTHHATSNAEVMAYLFCLGATAITNRGQTTPRPAGYVCPIDQYMP